MSRFSVCIIAKNEAKTLPRLIQSLKEYQDRGGEIILVDTGSSDNTAELARSLGCKVTEVGNRFVTTIDEDLAHEINDRFIEDEEPIVKGGDKLFDFASARNFSASLASNDMICTLDCDEAYTKFDLDKINQFIDEGYEQFEYNFIFAHDPWGRPAIDFVQSKFFDRRKVKWVGVVHEILQGQAKIKFLGTDVILLEHWQEPSENRIGYGVGLAWDCFNNPDKDRQSHYLGREFLWTNRPKSAIKELERHIGMNGWLQERAQSMIFIGDAYGKLNQPEKQVEWYNKAFYHDSSRREALMKLAGFYRYNNNPQSAAAYASAALEIPFSPYYANDKSHYENFPYEVRYWARGWMGNVEGAKEDLLKALSYQPNNPDYLRDTKFYFEYPDPGIDGWMAYPELLWLYQIAKHMGSVLELGSWKGRSTHALASGTKGTVVAVDHFQGSADTRDLTNQMAKEEDIYETFKRNTKDLKNITVNRNSGVEAAKDYPDKSFDMVFIDAGHTYEEVLEDIKTWLPKARTIFSGDDYLPETWMGVVKAVDEVFGKPDGIVGKVWYKYLVPKVSIIIPTLGRPEGLQRCLDSIKNLHYPPELIETIVIEDEPRLGVPKRLKQGVEQSTGEYIVYAANDMEFTPDSLITAITESKENKKRLIAFDTGVRNAEGFICEHFLIKRDLVEEIGGIFDTDISHVGVDDLLWKKCDRRGEAMISKGKVIHHHFSRIGSGVPKDEIIDLGWKDAEKDRELLAKKLDAIPKIIWTIWLNDKKKLPPLVYKCIKTHDLEGYEHRMISLDNCFRNQYVNDAIKAKMWGKACDYLRCYYLIEEGGIYLDADVEVLPGKNFDSLLDNKIFAGRENNNFVNTAVLGAEKGSQLLKDHLAEVVEKFKGDDGLFFESSVEIITPRLYKEARVLDPEYFYPYDHQQGTENITDKTITKHYFMKSWKK